MNRRELLPLVLCACVAATGCGGGEVRDQTPKSADGSPEAVAKAAVREFVAALGDSEKAAVLRLVDVPYFNHHWFEVIDDRAALERGYDEVFGTWTRSGKLPLSMTAVSRYREIRGALREVVRRTLDQVVTEDDFIVTLGDGPDQERYILVRVKGGAAKVVGVTTQ